MKRRPPPDNQAKVLRLLADGQPRSAAQVGVAFGMTPEWASTQLWRLWNRELVVVNDTWRISEHGRRVMETMT